MYNNDHAYVYASRAICLLVHIHGYNDTWLYGCLNLQDDPTSSPLKTRPHFDLYFLSYCKKTFFQDFSLTSLHCKTRKYGESQFPWEKSWFIWHWSCMWLLHNWWTLQHDPMQISDCGTPQPSPSTTRTSPTSGIQQHLPNLSSFYVCAPLLSCNSTLVLTEC